MKLISWNVNGIRACVQKGFLDFFHEADADIFCIQETKMQEGQLNLELKRYHQYWNYAVKKGYSGTAVFTKKEPLFLLGYHVTSRFLLSKPLSVIYLIGSCVKKIKSLAFLSILTLGQIAS